MRRTLRASLFVASLLLGRGPPAVLLAQPPQGSTLVLHAGWLIDGTGREPLVDAIMVIEQERIKAIRKAGDIAIPPGAAMIDARGKTIVPGLIDMHVHYQDWMDGLFLSHGVTTIRDVGNHLDTILMRRQWSRKPGAKQPRMFTCGPLIDGPNPRWGPRISRSVTTVESGPGGRPRVAGPPGGLSEGL